MGDLHSINGGQRKPRTYAERVANGLAAGGKIDLEASKHGLLIIDYSHLTNQTEDEPNETPTKQSP